VFGVREINIELNSPEMVDAMSALENDDFPLAFRRLSPLAEAGNPKAQCNLATLYHFGLGVEADGRKAVELYQGVAEQDIRQEHLSGIAYNNLATIYICGFPGIEADPEKASEYRNRAKALGFEM
jgi:TPR repeat protein